MRWARLALRGWWWRPRSAPARNGGAPPARALGQRWRPGARGEAPPIPDRQTLIDRVVAVVNDDVIMMSELQEAVVISRRDGKSPPDGAELERTMLNRLVDERLQVQEAKRDKVEVTEDELRAALDDVVKRNGGDREQIRGDAASAGSDLGSPCAAPSASSSSPRRSAVATSCGDPRSPRSRSTST